MNAAGTLPVVLPHVQSPSVTDAPSAARKWRPNFDKKAPKVWCPEKARTLKMYPKTAEAYEAMRQRNREALAQTRATGKLVRTGVPNGWSGRKPELATIQAQAAEEGRAVVAAARHVCILDEEDDPRAAEALETICEILRNKTVNTRHRVVAARLLLDFLMLQPVSRQQASPTAEAVLSTLLKVASLAPIPTSIPTTAIGGTAHADH
ncbi:MULTISPECIES: hypothetical protein [Roseomonadaceae]|uniref:Uncharacterized protein n=1 Tax=Falsiroseomonas oleicola TaxID=2801474 RepID=A0ABS6H9Y0_9PROT|nr:hypothetical protein [Roseomonas oleicola]MBU8544783.1 hypothetical protein [Roseomonas oleicola]